VRWVVDGNYKCRRRRRDHRQRMEEFVEAICVLNRVHDRG